ncbi:MAG: 30S ribosome-binding factor RbfA [Anaerolineales bacterium]|nr:30S ribosome-binding factor RbfA [Anaerolineales bacterium]
MVSKSRAVRIGDRIREELSGIVLMHSKDPRLAGLTITEVKVDRELAFASVYVCTIEGSDRAQDVLSGLEHAQGYLRSELAKRINLRQFPRLRFIWDVTYERAEKIERLFASLHTDEETSGEDGDAEPGS